MLSYIFVKRHSIFNHFTRAWICVCVCVCVSVVSHHTIWEPNQGGKGRRFLEELYLLTGSVNLCVCVGPIVLGTYGERITVGGGFVFFFFFFCRFHLLWADAGGRRNRVTGGKCGLLRTCDGGITSFLRYLKPHRRLPRPLPPSASSPNLFFRVRDSIVPPRIRR